MTAPTASEAHREIVRSHYQVVLRFFRTKIPRPDCYDVAHEALETFLKIPPERISGSPHAYLIGVARNHLKKYFARIRPSVPFDSARMSVAGATSMSERLGRRNALLDALRQLPCDQQIAVEQHLLERRTYQEVATALGVSLATAKRRVAEGRRALAERLADWRRDRQPPRDEAPDLDADTIEQLRAAYEDA